jgi:hypothetical protein
LEVGKVNQLEIKIYGKEKDIRHFRDLEVYLLAFEKAMNIFKLTKSFRVEEKYLFTNQIRRFSRSVCSNKFCF